MHRKIGVIVLTLILLGLALISSGADLSAETRAITSIEGAVTDSETGDPLGGAIVYRWSDIGTMERTRTDEEGYYAFELKTGGTYYLQVSMEGYEDGYQEVDVTIGDNEVVDFALVPLQLTCTVYGMMYDSESNEPLEGRVGLVEIETNEQLWTRVEENGEFRFEVEPGYYKLYPYVSKHYATYESEVFQLLDGDEKEMNIPMKKIPQGVHGTVTDAEGNPIPNAKISIENDEWRASAVSDENGEYDIRAPPGTYELQVNSEGFRPYRATVMFEEDTMFEYDIQLEEAVVLGFIAQLIRTIMDMNGIL